MKYICWKEAEAKKKIDKPIAPTITRVAPKERRRYRRKPPRFKKVEYPLDLLCWAVYFVGFFLSKAKYKMIGMPLSALALVWLLVLHHYYRSDFFAINLRLADLRILIILFSFIGLVLRAAGYTLPAIFFFGFLCYTVACLSLKEHVVPSEDWLTNSEVTAKKGNPASFGIQVFFGAVAGIATLILLQLSL